MIVVKTNEWKISNDTTGGRWPTKVAAERARILLWETYSASRGGIKDATHARVERANEWKITGDPTGGRWTSKQAALRAQAGLIALARTNQQQARRPMVITPNDQAQFRHATVVDARRIPSKAARFPIADTPHARNALARLGTAHDLPDEVRRDIAQRAANVLGEVTPGAEKYGVAELTKSKDMALRQGPIFIGRRYKTVP